MPSDHEEDEQGSLQERLEAIYCPPLDPSLVAAIAHDEGQTLQSAREVLDALARSARDEEEQREEAAFGSEGEAATAPPRESVVPDESQEERIERMLDEFHLGEEFDQEKGKGHTAAARGKTGGTASRRREKWSKLSSSDNKSSSPASSEQSSPDTTGDTQAEEAGEASTSRTSLDDLSDREFPPYDEVASKLHSSSSSTTASPPSSSNSNKEDPLDFLSHAFPTRTRAFLSETLQDCRRDVGVAIDTLMAIDMVEREEGDAAAEAMLRSSELADMSRSPSSSSSSSSTGGGLNFEALADGTRAVKGKKGRALRRKAMEEKLRASGGEVPVGKAGLTKVTLGDVRQGGGGGGGGSRPTSGSARKSGEAAGAASRAKDDFAGLSDREIAERLAKEDDPEAGEPVKDNQWLLTSSVLSQISVLLSLPPTQATSTYNASGFNLHIAVGRLIDSAASSYPTLQSLDEAGAAPEGTAQRIVESLASLSGKSRESAALCLRATKGRQDATLDLLNLVDVVREAAAGEKPDELDPLGKLRHPTPAADEAKRQRDGALASQQGLSSTTSNVDPRPGEVVDLAAMERARRAGGFSRAAAAGGSGVVPTGQAKAMASLRDGTAPAAVSFPPSAGATTGSAGLSEATQSLLAGVGGGGGGDTIRYDSRAPTAREREKRIAHAQGMAADYRLRRDRCLQQAGNAWRSTPGGKDRGAAFYYADEARRLEGKGRAWQLRAAEELVAYRRGKPSAYGHAGQGGVVDLHGVTVREALSIVSEELNVWWSRPSGAGVGVGQGRREALTIVTGAGRHSPNQVAILTPSVAKYLQREGWRADVDRQRGVIVVRGRV